MNLIYDQMLQEAAAARTEVRKQQILAELWPDEQRDFLRPPAKGVHAVVLIVASLAAAALLAVAAGVGLARADESHHRDVPWAMPEQGEQASWPQSLAGELLPGVCYQVDRYREDADLSFIDDGVLSGPSEDGHALDYDHPFPETGQPWKFVCVPEEEPTPTPEPTETPSSEEPTETPTTVEPTPEPSEEPSTPTPTEPPTTVEPSPEPSSPEPSVAPSPKPTQTPDIGTPTADERTPETAPPATAQQERLAETGSRDDVIRGGIAIALVALILGAALLIVSRRGAKR